MSILNYFFIGTIFTFIVDLLLSIKAFRNFTLWSEHLVLHTKLSLTKYLKIC